MKEYWIELKNKEDLDVETPFVPIDEYLVIPINVKHWMQIADRKIDNSKRVYDAEEVDELIKNLRKEGTIVIQLPKPQTDRSIITIKGSGGGAGGNGGSGWVTWNE